jgi:hypothetical protein
MEVSCEFSRLEIPHKFAGVRSFGEYWRWESQIGDLAPIRGLTGNAKTAAIIGEYCGRSRRRRIEFQRSLAGHGRR